MALNIKNLVFMIMNLDEDINIEMEMTYGDCWHELSDSADSMTIIVRIIIIYISIYNTNGQYYFTRYRSY